ncbi:MAG: PAS domain S-box protein [Deltaproteobacteria bacterium]|nr:PAS domain S-box protein [Deltaproteobacteria bacterium]
MTRTGRWRYPLLERGSGWLGGNRFPEKVAAAYILCGVFLLALTERYIHPVFPGYVDDAIYIACTSVILFLIVRSGVNALSAKEAALRESEDRLARILETNAGGIVVFDAKGVITFANHAAEKILSVERSRLIGLRHDDPAWDMTDADGAPIGHEELPVAKVRTTRMPVYDIQFGVRHRAGANVILSVNAAPLLDSSNEMVGTVASFTDITARKKGEDLRIRKLLLAVEQSPSAIVITDLEGNVEYANHRYALMTGCPVKEAIGGKMPHPCLTSSRRLEEMWSAIRSGKACHGEFECTRNGGEAYWESTTMTPIRTAEGEIANLLWVREDITDRKLVEEGLRRSEANYRTVQEKFRQIFEQNEEPLFLFRQGTGEILDANPAAALLYGCDREELRREGVSLFVPPADLHEFRSAIAAVRPGAGLSIDCARHLRKDGVRIVVSIRANSIRTGDEEVVYGSFRDITARIRMEDEAKHHQAQLIHANRMTSLGTIVSGVAHEVNNPNNLIMFNAPMILAAWEDAAPILDAYHRENGDFHLGGLPYSEMRSVVPRLAAGISDASVRIKTIVANLKDYARQEGPRRVAAIDVNDVVRTAIAILNHEIIKATHRFELILEEGLPPVNGSAQQLEQVVINLVNNSLQALPSNRRGLRVSTRNVPDTGEIEVTVEDEGAGMPPDVLARVAEPFFSTRTDSGGLGLGLSICRSIVDKHKGSLSFESEVGSGTRAVIRLPAVGAGAVRDALASRKG